MKYRLKLFFSFFALVFISTLLGVAISYYEGSTIFVDQMRSQILSIAETGGLSFNGNVVRSFTKENIKGNTQYEEMQKKLRKIRDLNRRKNIYVKYAYIIKPIPKHRQYVFVMDAEENPHQASYMGDIFPTDLGLLEAEGNPYVDQKYTKDHFGKWLSAYGPIYDDKGAEVAYLGVDLGAVFINKEVHILLYFGLISLGISLLISVIIAHFLSRLVTNSLAALCETVCSIGEGNLDTRIHLDSQDEFDELAYAINTMAKGLEERERLKTGFARYVSGYVLEKILKTDIPSNLAGERRKVTILFSDIRGFTALSEQFPPEEVVGLLNEYFEQMIEVIFKYNGTLDKFLGDGLMAEFGAPLEDEFQERNAVLAAIEMQQHITTLSAKWVAEKKPPINVGIGIHTGLAIVGNIGSDVRMEYTAIGDAVNVASRIEQATKVHKKKILISSATHEAISDAFTFEKLGGTMLPGREELIDIFSIDPDSIATPE
jgi:adenylate cyclase